MDKVLDNGGTLSGCRCQAGIVPSFDFYNTPLVDASQSLVLEEEITPQNALTVSPFELAIPAQPEAFVRLGSLTMSCEFKLVKKDGGTDINAAWNVATINNPLVSLWQSIQVRLNDIEVNALSSQHMPYKAIINNLLSYSPSAAGQLETAGFQVEKGEEMDTTALTAQGLTQDGLNPAYVARQKLVKGSKTYQVSGALPIDFLSSDNHLAPGTKLTLLCHMADPQFFLLGPDASKCRVKITQLALHVRKLRLKPHLAQRLLRTSNKPQRYLAPYSELKLLQIPEGVSRWTLPVYSDDTDVQPKQLIIGFVATDAVHSFTHNPFNFEHFQLCHLAVRVGNESHPKSPLNPNFDKNWCAREFYRLGSQTGKVQAGQSGQTLITMSNFLHGHCLFPVDLCPDSCNSGHVHKARHGKCAIDVAWEAPLTKAVTAIVYCHFDQIITVGPGLGQVRSLLI